MKKTPPVKKNINLSRILLIFGSVCLVISLGLTVFDRYQSQFSGQVPEIQVKENLPVLIKIPGLKIKLDLEPGFILNGRWTVSEKKATYLFTAGRPGTTTNTVIYGHNKWNIFGQLYRLQKGDEVIVQVQDGQEFRYEVAEKLTVKPDQLEYVLDHQKEELTLYTCTGLLDSRRLVIRALPKSN